MTMNLPLNSGSDVWIFGYTEAQVGWRQECSQEATAGAQAESDTGME